LAQKFRVLGTTFEMLVDTIRDAVRIKNAERQRIDPIANFFETLTVAGLFSIKRV
jgi:hypothetical protein